MSPGPDLERDDLVEALAALGMGKIDADVYLRLSTAGPQKAGPLAKLLGWNRAETYRVLQRLVESEFVEAALTRPVEFRAVPINLLFARLQRLQEEKLARLDASRSTVEARLAKLQQRGGADAEDDSGLHVVHDRARVLAVAERMVAEARSSITFLVTSTHLLRALAASGVLDTIERRARDGVAVRVLTEAGKVLPALLALGGGLRTTSSREEQALLIADGQEALAWLTISPTPRAHDESESALWTDAPAFLALQVGSMDAAWAAAGGAAAAFPSTGDPR